MQHLIPLADAITALREQLVEANQRASREALRFEISPIELELNLVVQREASASGKIGFKIFGYGADAGLDGKMSNELTNRIKITLTPKTQSGGSFDVSDGM